MTPTPTKSAARVISVRRRLRATLRTAMRGLLNGLQRALVTNVAEGQTGHIQVHRRGYMQNVVSTPLTLDFAVADLAPKVLGTPGVAAIAARIQFAGMLSAGEETLFTVAFALEPGAEPRVTPLRAAALGPGSGFFEQVGPAADGIVLTQELASAVGLQVGAEASLLAPDRDGALSGEPVHMAGLMNLSLPGERKVALVPLGLAQKLLRMEGRATELGVAVTTVDHADEVAAALRQRLGPDYEVHTWADVAMFVRQAMARQNFVIRLIAYAFMLLMLLGVANTMLMSVVERTREIGTMMAVGLRRAKILALFLIEALAIGAVGGALGAGAGALVVRELGQRGLRFSFPGSSVPFVLTPFVTIEYLGQILLMAAAGAGLFALYPAWRASRMRPVQALAGR